MANGFRDLKIWNDGYALLMSIHEQSLKFPQHEKFALTSQIERSANSVIANIAESCGRFYFLDKIKTLYHSRGELEETRSHLAVAKGFEYINEDIFLKLDSGYEKLSWALNNYINYLYSQNKDKENEKLQ